MPIPQRLVGHALLAALALAPPLLAGTSPWYVQTKAGPATLDADLGQQQTRLFDDDDLALGVEAGYRLNRFLALEAGYHALGSYDGGGSPCPDGTPACIERLALCAEGQACLEVFAPLTGDLTGYSVALVPRWPLSPHFAVFGKAGAMFWDADVSLPAGSFGGGRLGGASGNELLAAVGVRYDLERGLGFVLEHERVDFGFETTTLGIGWRF